jgi:hypothetical protein
MGLVFFLKKSENFTGRGGTSAGKHSCGRILSQISGQYFSGLFKDWDRFFSHPFPAIVELYLHKESNYRQKKL